MPLVLKPKYPTPFLPFLRQDPTVAQSGCDRAGSLWLQHSEYGETVVPAPPLYHTILEYCLMFVRRHL